MTRVLGLVLVLSVGHASLAFAGGSLLTSATRLVREAESGAPAAKFAGRRLQPASASAQAGQAPAVSETGLSKRTKLLIVIGAAAAFVGTAYAIDHRVRDVTPSSLGTRQD